ncbi:MAG: 5'-3' exonuclease H3TH domain-containing protein [Steroidobacteraceae bacterium]
MIYLVDASVYVFRAWYSLAPDLHDAEGNPTHALFGFARFIGDLVEQRRPQSIAVCFDESLRGGFRQQLFPAYKANREPAPPQLKRQFALCREFCRHLGVPEFASAEFEADDLIGTLAARARAAGLRFTLVSRDKDLAQLIGPGDVYWDYSDNVEYCYGQIAARFGVAPERMADYLALMGDAVDNIPGVPGIGAKTAAALMNAFESLEALYADLGRTAALEVRGAAGLAARLSLHREAAFLAQALTRIHCAAPLPEERAALLRRSPDLAALERFCQQQGFGLMLPRQAARIAALAA